MRLDVKHLSFSFGETKAIEDIALHVKKGEFVGIIGPNGSGKSTVLKSLYRALTPSKGEIMLDGENLATMPYKALARKLAVMGQEHEMPFDFTVEEMVAMGRSPHKKLFEIDNSRDKQMIRHALEHVGMADMAKRNFSQLSGGEKQRVIIARVIAQETDFLILDEPTNHLDINYQMQVFDFVKRLEVTVLAAIHDLNMAALYCDRLYVLKNGKNIMHGTPNEVLTPKNIYDVFGVRADVAIHPLTGKVSITFVPENNYRFDRREVS